MVYLDNTILYRGFKCVRGRGGEGEMEREREREGEREREREETGNKGEG